MALLQVVRRRLAEPWTIPAAALKLARALLDPARLRSLLEKDVAQPDLHYGEWRARYGKSLRVEERALPAGWAMNALEPGDEWTSDATHLIARAIEENPGADFVYGDEDSPAGPEFKPDWNPDLLQSVNYIGRAFASRTALEDAREIVHVPFVILHRRSPPAAPHPRHRQPLPEPAPLVSLIIPTRDRRDLLEKCISSLQNVTAYRNYEIIVVDNGTTDPSTLKYLETLPRVLRWPHPFNFSAINNFAVAQAKGSLVGLLNNDLEFIEPHWLEEMVSQAARPEIGCVGARLLYPDRTVQHAGVILGIGGYADHWHKDLPADAPGYCGRAQLVQNFSAVTAACLLVRKATYDAVGGFDESFAVAFNDVDFCLRVRERGLRNVWTPYATVIHHESKSRGAENTPAKWLRLRGELKRLTKRWGPLLANDPAYNPNLTLDARNASLAWPPRVSRH